MQNYRSVIKMVSNEKEVQNNFVRKLIISIAITFTLYMIMLLVTIPRVLVYSNGMEIPDLMVASYGFNYVYDFLMQIGELGRANYILQILVDMLYPFMLSLTFYIGLDYYVSKKQFNNYFASKLRYLPWIIMISDYGENLSILYSILNYPNHTFTEYLAPIFTMLKGFSNTLLFTIILLIVIYEVIQSQRQKKVVNIS